MHFPTLFAAIALIVAGNITSAFAETEVKLAYGFSQSSAYGVAAEKWAEVVTAESGGRFGFISFPDSELGTEREVLAKLLNGEVEASIVSASSLSAAVPGENLFLPRFSYPMRPFLFRDLNHAREVVDGPLGQAILRADEGSIIQSGLKPLAWGDQGMLHFANNRNPVVTPQDLAGMKLFINDASSYPAFEILGAAPLAGDLYDKGLLDDTGMIATYPFQVGVEGPLPVLAAAGSAQKQMKYLTLSGHSYAPAILLVSQSFWEALSDEDKAIFEKGAHEAASAMRGHTDEIAKKSIETLRDQGMAINELTGEQKRAFLAVIAPDVYEDDDILAPIVSERLR